MDIEILRDYCLQKPRVTEAFPFDDDTLVFKVGGKLFALVSLKENSSVNLKCNPERAIELRERFHAVQPGYHMNKQHWNTVRFNEDLDDRQLVELIDHSYELVVASLTKKLRSELGLG
jgi:predicted DNA-binding protein (MmcQ/YjbR family)